MLVAVHVIQNHAPSNLNRGKDGNPKDAIFGGVQRSRVSSQCQKRAIRQSPLFLKDMEDLGKGTRTRNLPRLVKEDLLKKGVPEAIATIAATTSSKIGKKTDGDAKESAKGKGKKSPEELHTQMLFLSDAEIANVVSVAASLFAGCKTEAEAEKITPSIMVKKIKECVGTPTPPDIALFGRMSTSESFNNVASSIQVAPPISTNQIQLELDYFTAVDDLNDGMEGAGHLGEVAFTSPCYYKYFSFDIDQLETNLSVGRTISKKELKEIISKLLASFIRTIVFASPSGYQNTYAAHQLPDAILVEIRQDAYTISYSNAFLKPSTPHLRANKDLVDDSIEKLVEFVAIYREKFSLDAVTPGRFWFSTRPVEMEAAVSCGNIDELVEKTTTFVKEW